MVDSLLSLFFLKGEHVGTCCDMWFDRDNTRGKSCSEGGNMWPCVDMSGDEHGAAWGTDCNTTP